MVFLRIASNWIRNCNGWCQGGRQPLSTESLHLRLQVAFFADALDQLKLGLQPVDVLFFVVEDLLKQIAADIVSSLFGLLDRVAIHWGSFQFQCQIAFQRLARIFTDSQSPQFLQIRQSLKEQNPFDQ